MNIVFLDIDGVLCSWLNMSKRDKDGHRPFRKDAIKYLNEIVRMLDAKIVISSTWRKTRTIEDFKELFDNRGILGEVIGLTDELDTGRASEIQKWIDENDVDYFLIIDDDTRGIEEHFKNSINVMRTNLYRCIDKYDYLYAKRAFELYDKFKKI